MVSHEYIRAEDIQQEIPEPKPVPKVKKPMVVKINRKPIRVEEEEVSEFSWTYLTVSTIGYLLAFYIMDLAGSLFLGVHPFPFIKFVGVILSWFGIH